MPAVILIDDKSRIESLMNDSMVAQWLPWFIFEW